MWRLDWGSVPAITALPIFVGLTGITDTTGNMGVLGRKLRENGQEHAYCTDHNFHLNAKLAFDG
jgi:hypothetical protein